MRRFRKPKNTGQYRVEAPDVAIAQVEEPQPVELPVGVRSSVATPLRPATELVNGPACKAVAQSAILWPDSTVVRAMKSLAKQCVDRLLESSAVPVCLACERKYGTAKMEPGESPSHGYCPSCMVDMYTNAPLNWPREKAQAHVSERGSKRQYWHDLDPSRKPSQPPA